jgi:hypothetical protein
MWFLKYCKNIANVAFCLEGKVFNVVYLFYSPSVYKELSSYRTVNSHNHHS